MKIKLTTTVYFDGVPYPTGSVIDPDSIGMNGEAALQWQWAEPVNDDAPVAIVPVYSDAVVEPAAEPVAAPIPEPMPEPPSEAVFATEPQRKRKPAN